MTLHFVKRKYKREERGKGEREIYCKGDEGLTKPFLKVREGVVCHNHKGRERNDKKQKGNLEPKHSKQCCIA